MGVGSRFPLIADLGLAGFHVVQEFLRPGRADRGADGGVETVFTKHQCDAIALEKYFCKFGTVLAGKASAADGLNLAEAVVGMMNAIALGYGDGYSPIGIGWNLGVNLLKKHNVTLILS